jgi:hypothetical protein
MLTDLEMESWRIVNRHMNSTDRNYDAMRETILEALKAVREADAKVADAAAKCADDVVSVPGYSDEVKVGVESTLRRTAENIAAAIRASA